MESNELKMICDSQNQKPLYPTNEDALHAVVRRQNEEWNRGSCRCSASEITIALVCSALVLVCADVLGVRSAIWLVMLPWLRVVASRWDILALLARFALRVDRAIRSHRPLADSAFARRLQLLRTSGTARQLLRAILD
jgi:hypothetical protein